MAIIRKGDKVAEAKLRDRAFQEDLDKFARNKKTLEKTPAGKRADRIHDKKGVNGASSAVYGERKAKDMTGPVSGSALAAKKDIKAGNKKRTVAREGSGIIEKGKLVKGGNEALKAKLDSKGKK
jgi:hypothetical protein